MRRRNHQADLAYLGPFATIEAQGSFGVRLIARTLDQDRRDYYHSIIIARKDSNIHTLGDLKGRSFAFTDPHSTSGYLYPNMALNKTALINLNSLQNPDHNPDHNLDQIFKNLGTHGFIEGQDSDYDSVRELKVPGRLFDND